MIIMATCHSQNLAELAAATWDNNKVKYAERHGYATCAKTCVTLYNAWRQQGHRIYISSYWQVSDLFLRENRV